jgi:hypothetical protein
MFVYGNKKRFSTKWFSFICIVLYHNFKAFTNVHAALLPFLFNLAT